MSKAPSEARLYSIDRAMKSKSSGLTCTAAPAARWFSRDNGLSGL
jgi:hypothetical protein